MATVAPQKVPLYSLADLKNTTHDTIPKLLAAPPHAYTPSHTHTTIRLTLGYTSVLIAGALFAVDYKFGWEHTKAYTPLAVLAYFTLNGFLTAWILFGEKGLVFDGRRPDGERLQIWDLGAKGKYEPVFKAKVAFQAEKEGNRGWFWKEIEAKYMEWFDEKGFIVEESLRAWLVGQTPALSAQADEAGLSVPDSTVSKEEMGSGKKGGKLRKKG